MSGCDRGTPILQFQHPTPWKRWSSSARVPGHALLAAPRSLRVPLRLAWRQVNSLTVKSAAHDVDIGKPPSRSAAQRRAAESLATRDTRQREGSVGPNIDDMRDDL